MSLVAHKVNTEFTDVIWVFNSSGSPVTGLVDANFSKVATRNGGYAAFTITVTEIDSANAPGAYKVVWTPNNTGVWIVRVSHATYSPRGWLIELDVTTRALDDHAFPVTSGRGIEVDAAGLVDADVQKWMDTVPATLNGTYMRSDIQTWLGSIPGSLSSGNVKADVEQWRTTTPNTLIAGRVDANAQVVGDKTGYALSSAGVQAIWDALTTALTTVGSVGKRIADNLDATISSRPAGSDYTAARAAKLDNLDAAVSTRATPADVPSAGANADAVWDEARAGHVAAGSFGEGTNVVSILTGALAAASIASAAANKVADHVLRRSLASAAASSDGDAVSFRSPLGALRKLVNKVAVVGSLLSIYEEDDVTVAGTQNVTTDSNANPIVSADTN